MAERLLLGIDAGTTGTKAVLARADGAVVAQAGREYPTYFPEPNAAEQDPDDWWCALCAIVPELLSAASAPASSIAAISVSSQAPTVVPVDVSLQPVGNARIWMDRRAEPECEWLRREVGEDRFTLCNGGRIDPYFLAPKLMGYLRDQRRRGSDGEQPAHILSTAGYMVARLTGRAVMDASHGPLTLLFDSTQQRWSDELVAACGIDARLLPEVLACDEVAGGVTPEAAAATGLAAGTPVLAGMVDGTAAAIEANVLAPGSAVEMTGQSTVVMVCSDAPFPSRDLFMLGHAIEQRWLVVGAMVATGGSLRWFRDQLAPMEKQSAAKQGVDVFDLLTAEAAQSEPGANRVIFLPYMYGERSPLWDSDARGVFFGLSLATRRGDMVRAILEGAAFGLRHILEIAEQGGFRAQSLVCVGGGARSPLWNQIKADVLQRPILVPQAATGAPMGNAILASVAAGCHASLSEAVHAMVHTGKEVHPNPEHAERYDSVYRIYRELYPALRDAYRALAALPQV